MNYFLIFFMVIVSIVGLQNRDTFEHHFEESKFTPTYDDSCLRQAGYLNISNVSKDSLYIETSVSNGSFRGTIEGMASIRTKDIAEIIFDEGDEYEAIFSIFLSEDRQIIFLKCEGGCTMHSGMGVCLEGFYLK